MRGALLVHDSEGAYGPFVCRGATAGVVSRPYFLAGHYYKSQKKIKSNQIKSNQIKSNWLSKYRSMKVRE
jgi:hypothetical protein